MKRPAIKKSFVIHPFLFAVFPILALYAYNKAELSFSVTLLPLAYASGFALLLLAASWTLPDPDWRQFGKKADMGVDNNP